MSLGTFMTTVSATLVSAVSVGVIVLYNFTKPIPNAQKVDGKLVFGNVGLTTMYVHSAELVGRVEEPVDMTLFGEHTVARAYGKGEAHIIDKEGEYDKIKLKYSCYRTPLVRPFLITKTLKVYDDTT